MKKEWKLFIYENKARKIRGKNYSKLNFQIISFLFLFNLISDSEIHLIIEGNGAQNLINGGIDFEPSAVLVNGALKVSCNKTCELEGNKNNITLRFSSEINKFTNLFKGLQNIIEVDLSDFNATKVIFMEHMFNGCSNLEKINNN